MPKNSTITAVVLAAGFSGRMGRFKPLLPLGPDLVIKRVINFFHTAGVEDIIVVVGHCAEKVREIIVPLNVQCVKNQDYRQGMFTSVLAGIRTLSEQCRAFFIHPADTPLVRPQTVRQLITAYRKTSAAIVYPTFSGRRGHPTLIDTYFKPGIQKWSGIGGLRAFLKQHKEESLDLTVVDEGVVLDLDWPEDYRHMQARQIHDGLPSDEECRVLMDEIRNLPVPIKAHCKAVSIVAQRLAQALQAAGVQLDPELVRTAALLHDIARTQKRDHAHIGADLLAYHGFERLAPVVRAHMDLKVHTDALIDETQVVYLADKLVHNDRRVDLEQRFARQMEKFSATPDALAAILNRRENARYIRAKVEEITGRNIDIITGPCEQFDGVG